jgi:hypothetical protein
MNKYHSTVMTHTGDNLKKVILMDWGGHKKVEGWRKCLFLSFSCHDILKFSVPARGKVEKEYNSMIYIQ